MTDAPEVLSFPELVWKNGQNLLAIEVSIDFIPEQFRGKWLHVVQNFTDDWVKKTGFSNKGTLWMWGTMSANYLALNGGPSWSEFVIQFGLPQSFFDRLEQHLSITFDNRASFKEYVTPSSDDGWTAICHVEAGKAWREDNADTWVPVKL